MMALLPSIERELREAALRLDAEEVRAAAATRTPSRRRRSAWRSPMNIRILRGGLVAASAVVVAVAVLNLATGPELAILRTAEADASAIAKYVPGVVGSTTRLGSAHPFATPNGTGYVFETDDDMLCLVVPDSVPESYGATCSPLEEARSRGLVATLAIEEGDAGSGLVTAVLPAGVGSASWQPVGAPARTLRPANGVVVLPSRDGSLAWRTDDGTERKEQVQRYLPTGRVMVDCGHGRFVRLAKGADPAGACDG